MMLPALRQSGAPALPALVAAEGEQAATRYVEFFTARIRNPNTRAAYARAAAGFLAWCGELGLSLAAIRPVHVAAWVEQQGRAHSAPTVKQRLAAVRMLLDWLVVGQVVPHNPAHAVKGPRHSTARGKTRMPTRDEAKALLAAIPADGLVGLRDRALIGTLFYSFARVSAALAMRVEDYYPIGRRWWLRLHEKGGRHHEMPAHHALQDALDAYLEAAGIAGDRKGPLFRSARGRTGRLTGQAMTRADVYRMIGRRAAAAGVATRIGCHSWRARGITAYLENGGLLEHAQAMAARPVRSTPLAGPAGSADAAGRARPRGRPGT